MKFLNIDAHVSVVKDIQTLFNHLGHEVVRRSLSGHNWVDAIEDSNLKAINRRNWRSIDQRMVGRFYKKYKDAFDSFDGFVHSYPPAFAMLFEPFGKPIVTVTCTRFDFPTFPANYQWMVEGLRRMSSSGQLTMIANNKLDKFYNEQFLGIDTEHISSICDYLEPRTGSGDGEFLLWTRGGQNLDSPRISKTFSIDKKYDRDKIRNKQGVVHLPYNLSIMSAFEHYWQGIPLYFPSLENQKLLYASGQRGVLGEVLFPRTMLYFEEDLIGLADWYDNDNFRGVRLFEDVEHLNEMLENDDHQNISEQMQAHNIGRLDKALRQWETVLQRIS